MYEVFQLCSVEMTSSQKPVTLLEQETSPSAGEVAKMNSAAAAWE